MLIFQRPFVWRSLGPSDRPRRPIGLPLMEVPSLGPSRSCLGKRRAACVQVRLVSRTWRAVVVGHAHAPSRLTRPHLVEQGVSCWSRRVPSNSHQHRIPISIKFSSALNRGRERVFCPNLSPFSHRCVSSLNRGGERSSCPIPLPIPELALLLLLPFHRARSHVMAVPK